MGKIPAAEQIRVGEILLVERLAWKGLQWLGAKNIILFNNWNEIHGIEIRVTVGMRVLPYLLET